MTDMEKGQGMRLCKRTVSRMLFCLLVLAQIALAVLFFVKNPDFTGMVAETLDYELGARSGIIDEYMGPLYPLLLRWAISLQRATIVPYYVYVYVFHVLVFVPAVLFFVSTIYKGIAKYLVAGVVCTLPLTLKCIFQVSPFLLRCVFAMYLVGSIIRIGKKEGKMVVHWCTLALAYVGAAMNIPDDGYLWGIALLIFVVWGFRTKTVKQRIYGMLFVLFLIFVTVMAQKKLEISGGHGRMQRTISSTVFVNCMWENGPEKNAYVKEHFGSELSMTDWPILQGKEDLLKEYGAQFDFQLGKKQANHFYRKASVILFGKYGWSIVADFVFLCLKNAWNTVVFNWTAVCLCILSFAVWVKKKNPYVKWLWIGVVFELVFAAFMRGPLWDMRFCLFALNLIILLSLQHEKSEGEEKVVSCLNSLKVFYKNKKQIIVLIVMVLLVGSCAVGFLYSQNLQNRKQKLSGRVVCLGDSIWGFYKGVGGIGAFIEEETGLKIETYAIPGTSVCKRADDSKAGESLEAIVEALSGDAGAEITSETEEIIESIHLENVKMVILSYGLNDYFAGTNPDAYGDGLRSAIEAIRKVNSDTEICVMGPTQCLNYQNGVVVSTGSETDFGGGMLDVYCKVAKDVATEQQTWFVDMQQELSMNRYNGDHMSSDGTHLTEYGRKKYAQAFIKHILKDKRFYNSLIK